MRFMDIALFLLILNLTMSFLINLPLGFETKVQPSEIKKSPYEQYERELERGISSGEIEATSESNWLVESLKMTLTALPVFIKTIAFGTVLFPMMLSQYFGTLWGLEPNVYIPIVVALSIPIYLIYLFALLEFISGRQTR